MRFPLSNGLATGSWVVLKRGSQWIDRKFINYPNTLKPDPGVEVAVEPMTELMALVTGGEGAMVEFKSIIPESGSELRDKVCRAVAAFANGDGGQLLFGVADDGNMVGLGSIDAQKACDTVARFVSSIVIPIPGFRVDSVLADSEDDDSRLVLVLTVDQGGQPPYGVNPAHPRYYIRRGATTFEASADQVRALARSRPPTENQGGSLFGPQFWK
jgi:predicted HTH transcriptional regulator